MLAWDVGNGLARRAWAGNAGARFSVDVAMGEDAGLCVTLPAEAEPALLGEALEAAFGTPPTAEG
jgi:urocanate hydratase